MVQVEDENITDRKVQHVLVCTRFHYRVYSRYLGWCLRLWLTLVCDYQSL